MLKLIGQMHLRAATAFTFASVPTCCAVGATSALALGGVGQQQFCAFVRHNRQKKL